MAWHARGSFDWNGWVVDLRLGYHCRGRLLRGEEVGTSKKGGSDGGGRQKGGKNKSQTSPLFVVGLSAVAVGPWQPKFRRRHTYLGPTANLPLLMLFLNPHHIIS
jgi:hypothetical protein